MGESHQQQQPLLRSINNEHKSFVKFINKTLHNVILYWIDYQGQAVSYGVLSPGDCRLIDTFDTHPWIFVDQETRDRWDPASHLRQAFSFHRVPSSSAGAMGFAPSRSPVWLVELLGYFPSDDPVSINRIKVSPIEPASASNEDRVDPEEWTSSWSG